MAIESKLAGQTALVTGASSGLGEAVARHLLELGARVLMVARDQSRGEAARTRLIDDTGRPDVELLLCDLASQRQIRVLADKVRRYGALHFLVNNAGTAFAQRGLTEDGVERTLAVNHLAPFLLTNLLLDVLKVSAPARIVNVGTKIDTKMELTDLNWARRRFRMMGAYGESKLGNIHFTRELARRLKGSQVTVNCVFPGVFRSNLGGTDGAQGILWKSVSVLLGWALPTPSQAAQRVLYLLTDDEVAQVTGAYYGDRVVLSAPAQADDPKANAAVWRASAQLTGIESYSGSERRP